MDLERHQASFGSICRLMMRMMMMNAKDSKSFSRSCVHARIDCAICPILPRLVDEKPGSDRDWLRWMISTSLGRSAASAWTLWADDLADTGFNSSFETRYIPAERVGAATYGLFFLRYASRAT